MIDCARWVIAEAWLANGLRIRWSSESEATLRKDVGWQGGREDGGYYRYAGFGEWEVARPSNWHSRSYGESVAPVLSSDAMRHELAHWLVASEDERHLQNFGIADKGAHADEAEGRAMAAERVLSSVVDAAARIAALALGGNIR